MTPGSGIAGPVAASGTVATRAILALGSNLGDREATLRAAARDIADIDGVSLIAASGIVETPALKLHGVDHTAPAYLNAALAVATTLTPDALLDAVAAIELDHGRVREERWGDRTLDIDIVAMGSLVLTSERLTLPHPRAAERGFVLAPWLQIEPDAVLPPEGAAGPRRVSDLLAATTDDVRIYSAEALL